MPPRPRASGRPKTGVASRAGIGAAATTGLLTAAAALLPAHAFQEGPPWEVAGQDGCAQCHFDAPPTDPSEAVSVDGLPAEIAPGADYTLTVRLADPALVTAGFLLSAWQEGQAAGTFAALDARVEANGALARSTELGSEPAEAGAAEWTVEWRAPDVLAAPVVLELWANAGNDDQSPFGDSTHRRVWEVPIGHAGAEAGSSRHKTGSPTARKDDGSAGRQDGDTAEE